MARMILGHSLGTPSTMQQRKNTTIASGNSMSKLGTNIQPVAPLGSNTGKARRR